MSIEIANIKKSFGRTQVLNDISLDIPSGQMVALLGPSGSGKTTLLRMVNRMVEPTAGQVLVRGRDVADADPVELRRSIGYVMQHSCLMPHRTALDNVADIARLAGASKKGARERALEMLELVNLDPALADRYPGELSGGQAQRVGVARGLVNRPDIIMMDEPFAALDAITRDLLHGELERVWRQTGRTVVFVTHNVAEAVRLGQRVLLLSSRPGRVVAEWDVPAAARHDAPAAAALTAAITARLGQEIRRHAH